MFGPEFTTATRQSKLVELTRPELADADIMLTWAQNKASMDSLAAPDSDPVRESASRQTEIERIEGFETNQDNITWAITYDRRLVGQVWIDIDQDEASKSGHLSILIGDESVRNQGIGQAAESRVLEWALGEGESVGGFAVIKAWCLEQNTISRQVLTSLGFAYSHQDVSDDLVAGEYPTRHHYQMTAQHWKTAK